MININNITSLTDFHRNAKRILRELKKSGKPQVLTINGKAELVVQDAASYQRMVEALEHSDALAGIQRGIDAFNGKEGYPISRSLNRIRKKYGIPRPHSSRSRRRD